MRQYEEHNTPLDYHTDQGPKGCSQYDGQVEYFGLNAASEAFHILTTNNIHGNE